MNRIEELFKQKKQNNLSVYFTAGYPALNDTKRILHLLQSSGADLVEIGIPFSDPLADGPVIQQSSSKALQNGLTLKVLMEQLKDIRKTVSIPLILMGYLNPVLQYGIEKFCKDAEQCGIDGLILPDLPMDVYAKEYKALFTRHNLKNILLVTPQTPEERIRKIDELSEGFIYAVSASATTGASKAGMDEKEKYFQRLQHLNLRNPVMIGFGIANHAQFNHACRYASGAIIGSAFIQYITQKPDLEKSIPQFISSIKETQQIIPIT